MIKPSSTAKKRRTNGGKRGGRESFASQIDGDQHIEQFFTAAIKVQNTL